MLVGKKKGYYRKQAANDLIDLAIEIVLSIDRRRYNNEGKNISQNNCSRSSIIVKYFCIHTYGKCRGTG